MQVQVDYTEKDLEIWNKELKDFLPDKIFDSHCHIWLKEHIRKKAEHEVVNPSLPKVCEEFGLEDLLEAESALFPGKKVEMLMFGNPEKEIKIEENNKYASLSSENSRNYALMIPPIEAKVEELDSVVSDGHFVGFKPYWTFVTWKEQNDVLIEDMVTEAQLEVANKRGLIILLHIPRKLRLADPYNLKSIKRIAKEYPNLKLVIAHIGRAYCSWPAKVGLEELKDLENVYFDTAMVQNPVSYQLLFRKIDKSRILFGTDLPIAMEKGKVVCVNNRNLFVTTKKYPWSLSMIGGKEEIECTFFAYEIIRAIKEAAELESLSVADVNSIFYGNAKKLIESVLKGLENEVATIRLNKT